MYLEINEILHLENKKIYKVLNFSKINNIYYYLLENVDNNKFIVVTAHLIGAELYLKEEKNENILNKLNFK